jgi:hypothetical protein
LQEDEVLKSLKVFDRENKASLTRENHGQEEENRAKHQVTKQIRAIFSKKKASVREIVDGIHRANLTVQAKQVGHTRMLWRSGLEFRV